MKLFRWTVPEFPLSRVERRNHKRARKRRDLLVRSPNAEVEDLIEENLMLTEGEKKRLRRLIRNSRGGRSSAIFMMIFGSLFVVLHWSGWTAFNTFSEIPHRERSDLEYGDLVNVLNFVMGLAFVIAGVQAIFHLRHISDLKALIKSSAEQDVPAKSDRAGG